MTTATRSHKTSVTKNQAHATRPRSFLCKRVAGCLGTGGAVDHAVRIVQVSGREGPDQPWGPLETFQKLRGRVGLLWQSRWFHDQNLQMLIAAQWFPSPFPNMQLSVTPHMGNDPPHPTPPTIRQYKWALTQISPKPDGGICLAVPFSSHVEAVHGA